MPDLKYTKPWHGVPREEIDWNPTVIEDACIGCGTCVTGCSRLVYRYDFERRKAVCSGGPFELHGGMYHLRQHLSDARHPLPAAIYGVRA